ncbi:hypothetical protein BH09BAC1_BH09BAC1_07480 [soil metagenome]
MKTMVLIATIIACCTLGLTAQNAAGYVVAEVLTYDKAKLVAALNKCRFDNYRKMDERVTLTFEDGSTVQLLSVKEMQHQGLACDITIVTPNTTAQNNIFILHPDGYVMEQVRAGMGSYGSKQQTFDDYQRQQKK